MQHKNPRQDSPISVQPASMKMPISQKIKGMIQAYKQELAKKDQQITALSAIQKNQQDIMETLIKTNEQHATVLEEKDQKILMLEQQIKEQADRITELESQLNKTADDQFIADIFSEEVLMSSDDTAILLSQPPSIPNTQPKIAKQLQLGFITPQQGSKPIQKNEELEHKMDIKFNGFSFNNTLKK